MSQRTHGFHSILSSSWIYDQFQNAVGARAARRWLVDEVIRPVPGQRVLDIGCGTGAILEVLPDVEYTGIDLSQEYIDTARRRFQNRGRFIASSATELDLGPNEKFDVILAFGLLHHLDDVQVNTVLASAAELLAPDGRLTTIDPTLVDGQHPMARWMINNDRGQNVRRPDVLLQLAREHFSNATVEVKSDLLRIPYSHVLLRCP